MTRSEFAKIVNEVAAAENKRIMQQVDEIFSLPNSVEKIAKAVGLLIAEIPSTSARSAAMIIEKSGLLTFDPETE